MEIIFVIAILIFSVIIHEVSHGYMADYLGDPTARHSGRLTLDPRSHLDPVGSFIVPLLTFFSGGFIFGWAKPVPYNPYNLRNSRWSEAMVAGVGPLSNIVIALFFGTIIRFNGIYMLFPESAVSLLSMVVFINIILAVFNLVPIPPLDGSKILFSVLPYRYMKVRYFLEKYGLILVLLFIFLLWSAIFPIITFIFDLFTGTNIY